MLSVSLLLAAFAACSPAQGAAVQKRDLFGCFEQNCSTPTIDFPLPAGAPIPDASTTGNLTYDYVIVGAGTTGSTVASRLSENPAIRVAVIEAGTDYVNRPLSNALVSIPGLDVLGVGSSPEDFFDVTIDWGFQTTPQAGANNRVVQYARGKVLGGSSSRNFMLYQRPTVGAQNTWVTLTGDPQWSWDNTYADYKRSVQFTPPNEALRQEIPQAQYDPSAYSASGGPLQVSYPNFPQGFSKYAELSMNENGISTIRDFNAGKLLGTQYAAATINPKGGFRSSSRASFLEAARTRPNLDVFQGALAKKILFDTTGFTPRATGVTFTKSVLGLLPTTYTVTATREVIISAGAFQSPQLLKVSGIGPKAELQSFNIPVLVNSANVGENMQDHIFVGPAYETNTSQFDTFTRLATDIPYTAAQFLNFSAAQLGPFTNNVADLLAFVRPNDTELDALGASVIKTYPRDWPTNEFFSAPGYVGDFASLLIDNFRLGRAGVAGIGSKQFATMLAAIVAPQSKGRVTLKSADTNDLPNIDMAWLEDPVDQKLAVYGFKRVRQFFAANAMKPARANDQEFYPGLDVSDDAAILNHIRNNLMTVWHAATTCRAGTNPSNSVLDSNLRVWGIKSLRVADASSFPQLLPGHPQSVLYMLGERTTTLLRKQNGHA